MGVCLMVEITPPMNAEDELSDLLSRWHHWQSVYRITKGYPTRAAGTESWRCSTQHDSENGARDADNEKTQMDVVDFEVHQIEEPGRTALHVNAKAIALGISVFRSPRLPENQVMVLEIISTARDELARRLRVRGVL